MTTYWLMFLMPALATFNFSDLKRRDGNHIWVAVIIILTLLIGLRHEVGGDWFDYFRHWNSVQNATLQETLARSDPGYYFVNWLIARLGGSIYMVNLFCGATIMIGVSYFAKRQPMPWLSLLVAIPYLLVVVAMGYTRQSAALGFALIGLAELGGQRIRNFVFWIVLGALFHKSALLLLPIAALGAAQNRLWTIIWVGVTGIFAGKFLLFEAADDLWVNYVEAGYSSQGGLIRVLMNAVPSIILLVFKDKLYLTEGEKKLWTWMAVFSLASVGLVNYSSTAVDRVALYFIPIQMYIFARVPLLASTLQQCKGLMIGVMAYYALVLFVWLNFAFHAFAWLPYQNSLIHDTSKTYGEPELFDKLPFSPDLLPRKH